MSLVPQPSSIEIGAVMLVKRQLQGLFSSADAQLVFSPTYGRYVVAVELDANVAYRLPSSVWNVPVVLYVPPPDLTISRSDRLWGPTILNTRNPATWRKGLGFGNPVLYSSGQGFEGVPPWFPVDPVYGQASPQDTVSCIDPPLGYCYPVPQPYGDQRGAYPAYSVLSPM